MDEKKSKRIRAKKRAMRVRKKIMGTEKKPRLTVFRSHKNIMAQLIDDLQGRTIASASSVSGNVRSSGKRGVEIAALVGEEIGKKAKDAGIESCLFDRGCYSYHGRVKALADAARKVGLRF